MFPASLLHLFLFQTSEQVETVFLVSEPCDLDQPMAEQPQVVVGLPPCQAPPPPPGACMTHADDVTEDWASDEESSNANHSSGNLHDDVSDDDASSDASNASEDAISVLAQAAVEEAMEAAVRQANDASLAVSLSEQPLTSMEANDRSRTWCDVGPGSSLSRQNHDEEDSADSEDEGGWRFGDNSPPPSLTRPSSMFSPCSANQTQPRDQRKDENNESEHGKVTHESHLCPSGSAPS